MSIIDSVEYCTEQWRKWQADVVASVRRELFELSDSIHGDDFDWEAWRSYFDAGYLPIDAVREAICLPVSDRLSGPNGAVSAAIGSRMLLPVD